jgi:hypothetical protein
LPWILSRFLYRETFESANEIRVYLNKVGTPGRFSGGGFLDTLAFLRFLCVKANGVVFARKTSTQRTQRKEGTRRGIAAPSGIRTESDGQIGRFGEKVANIAINREGNSKATYGGVSHGKLQKRF